MTDTAGFGSTTVTGAVYQIIHPAGHTRTSSSTPMVEQPCTVTQFLGDTCASFSSLPSLHLIPHRPHGPHHLEPIPLISIRNRQG
jgi:hypothetical protein